LSTLELARHKLRIAHDLTLVTPNLHGWEASPLPGALTHTRITWALSSPAPQVPGVTPGSPVCPWCSGHSSWRSARQRRPLDTFSWALTTPRSRQPESQLHGHNSTVTGWTRAFQNPYTMAGRVPTVDTIIRDDTRVLSRIPAQLWSKRSIATTSTLCACWCFSYYGFCT
jgi:hypothetical protein